MRIQLLVDPGHYPSIFDVMRDRYGVTRVRRATTTLATVNAPSARITPLSTPLPGYRHLDRSHLSRPTEPASLSKLTPIDEVAHAAWVLFTHESTEPGQSPGCSESKDGRNPPDEVPRVEGQTTPAATAVSDQT